MTSLNRHDQVLYLTFDHFRQVPFIRHAFSTREGGVSTSEFESMNLGFGRGDRDENVRENFRLFCDAAGIGMDGLVFGAQTHSANVRRVYALDRGCGIRRPVPWDNVDGLMTDDPGVFLATFYADCVPLFFVDPIRRAVALSHAGWKGTAANIAAATLRAMTAEFGSDPADILAAIGPSIGKCCFEIGAEVAEVLLGLGDGLSGGCVTPAEVRTDGAAGRKYFADLRGINRRMLEAGGVRPCHIETADLCTSCNSGWLFSHRASKGRRGSLCAVLGMA